MEPHQFYSTPWVMKELCGQFRNRYVNIRFPYGMRRHYNKHELNIISSNGIQLVGNDDRPFFEISSLSGMSPTSIGYFIKQGAVEFIPEVSVINDLDRTNVIIIDLDPKSLDFDFEDLRNVTYKVLMCMLGYRYENGRLVECKIDLTNEVTVEKYKVRFSGNRSFHLYLLLNRLVDFVELRKIVKERLDPLCEEDETLSYRNIRDKNDYILIDIGALARHRCVRSLWSMHHKTRRVCVPVRDIFSFGRDEAIPENVIARGPTKELF